MSKLAPHFSLTRRAGGFVFVSGQLPFDENMQLVGDDIKAQTQRCLDNLAGALATENLGLKDIVKVTVWLSRAEDFATFNATYAAYFPELPPVRTTVGSTLMVPGALIEMDAQAYAG